MTNDYPVRESCVRCHMRPAITPPAEWGALKEAGEEYTPFCRECLAELEAAAADAR